MFKKLKAVFNFLSWDAKTNSQILRRRFITAGLHATWRVVWTKIKLAQAKFQPDSPFFASTVNCYNKECQVCLESFRPGACKDAERFKPRHDRLRSDKNRVSEMEQAYRLAERTLRVDRCWRPLQVQQRDEQRTVSPDSVKFKAPKNCRPAHIPPLTQEH
jgi:hypothetical protein